MNRCSNPDCPAPKGLCLEQASPEYLKCEYWLGDKVAVVQAACATKDLDPALVIGVRLDAYDIFLKTVALGEIRVERSALPALMQGGPEPETFLIPGIPLNTLAALVEAGYTTAHAFDVASDEDLLAVDGVGAAMLKRIRAAIIDEATAVDVDGGDISL